MMTPVVSVVMAVHKDSPYLMDAIDSILSQTLKNFEFIIVFNGLDEDLLDNLRSINDERIKVLTTYVRQLSFNLNFGINFSNSEFIARMDYDDISVPNRLMTQYTYLVNNPEVDVLGSDCNLINELGEDIGRLEYPKTNKNIRSSLPFKNSFAHPSVMFRKQKIVNHNSYLGGMFSEDYSLWLRLSRFEDIGFKNLDEVVLKYRKHSNQSSGNLIAYAEAASLVFVEFIVQKKIVYLFGFIISIAKLGKYLFNNIKLLRIFS